MSGQTAVEAPATSWVMVMQLGVFVDGVWTEWLPAKTTEGHGWVSPEEAVAFWRHPDRAHTFKAFRNGREASTNFVATAHGGPPSPVFRRVWFEEVRRG